MIGPVRHVSKIAFRTIKEHEKRARVHFLPDLKVGVFVTLCAPELITLLLVWR